MTIQSNYHISLSVMLLMLGWNLIIVKIVI